MNPKLDVACRLFVALPGNFPSREELCRLFRFSTWPSNFTDTETPKLSIARHGDHPLRIRDTDDRIRELVRDFVTRHGGVWPLEMDAAFVLAALAEK